MFLYRRAPPQIFAEPFRQLVERVPDYAVIVMDEAGRILSWNPGAERVFGWAEHEMRGQPYEQLFTFEDRAQNLPRVELLRAARDGRANDERWHVCKDGSRFFATGVVVALDAGEACYAKLLHDDTNRQTVQAELARATRIAETLQRSLLPAVPLDAFASLEVVTAYQPALTEAAVGGDFYDAFALDGGKVALVVGDASGKGLSAATRTAEVRHALRAFLREHADAGGALARLNNYVCDMQRLDDRHTDGFIVVSLAIVGPGNDVVFASAGGEPPLILRADGTTESVAAGGLILGCEPGETYQTTTGQLLPGDILLMVTDGLTEARRHSDFLGYEGMAHLAASAARTAPALWDLSAALLAGAMAFAGGSLHDDVCLLLARPRRARS